MEKRTINQINASLLGFGCMRFPLNEDNKINREETFKMLDKAYESGITYYDTAYPYHEGESEIVLGEWAKTKPRESLLLVTKSPMWEVNSVDDFYRIFEEQLNKLQTDYIDLYLLHALGKESWQKVKDLHLLDHMTKLKESGKILNVGFSFHDDYEVFEEIVKAYPWDFCQIQYNYMDVNYQAGDKGYKLCEEFKIPMVIMEPIKGGQLAKIPEELMSDLKKFAPDRSDASWALRWVASHPNVLTVLSGMSTMEQVEDNIHTFTHFKALTDEENKAINQLRENLEKRIQVLCTGCEYCMPCPFGVNIPRNFALWNRASMYDKHEEMKKRYEKMEAKASLCKDCGKCETVCPQHLPIREHLKLVAKDLSE